MRRAGPILVLLLLALTLVAPAIGPGKTLSGFDVFHGSAQIREFVGRSLAAGRLPVWDPHAMCGFPLLAALQAGTFYPLTWPAIFLSGGAFWTFTVAAHLALSGLFAYAWLRRGLPAGRPAALAGSLVFMLSGFFAVHVYAGHITQISAYPWLAAILWRVERYLAGPSLRRGALLGGAMALLFLTGFPHFVLVAGLLAGLRLIRHAIAERRWRPAAGAAAALGWGLLLAAPQLLPALELAPRAQRVSVHQYEFVTSYSYPPENLLLLFAPRFFGDGLSVPYWGRWALWEVTAFVGLSGLMLAAVGLSGRHPARRFWAAVAVGGLLVAFGSYTPVFRLFYEIVPGAGLFRMPARYLSVFVLALAPLVAMGVDRLLSDEEEERRTLLRRVAVAGAAAALGASLWIGGRIAGPESDLWYFVVTHARSGDGPMPPPPLPRTPEARARIFRPAMASLGWAAFGALGIASLLALQALGRIRARAVGWTLLALLGAELALFARPYFQPRETAALYWPEPFLQEARGRPDRPFRIASSRHTHVADVGRCQAAGLDHIGGYESLTLARYAQLMNTLSGFSPEAISVSAPAPGPHPAYAMLGARLWVVADARAIPSGWKEVGRAGASRVFESPDALPRAFVVPRAVRIDAPEERLRRLSSPDFDPRGEVIVESDPGPPGAPGSARVLSSAPGEYRLEADAPGGGYLVLAETNYPGWRAEVDGKPAPILVANHFLQAVRLEPGRHEVRFTFRSTYLGTGFLLGILALAGPALVILARRVKTRG